MKKILFGVLTSFTILSLISCGSKPEPETEPVKEPEIEIKVPEPEIPAPVIVDNSEELSKADEARQKAIDAGAKDLCPVQFAAADALYEAVSAQAKTGLDSSAALKDLQDRYNALANYSAALSAKKKIDEKEFASYNQSKYDEGTEALKEFEDIFNLNNVLGSSMLEKADKAKSSFDAVLFSAYKKLAKDERAGAYSAKVDADGIKAGVAQKEDYNKAVQEFKAGDSSYAMQNPESALNHYKVSKEGFVSVYAKVLTAREAAQRAMENARNKVAESEDYAEKADAEAPLVGDNIQGIEAEDAKLLEDDNYEDPTSQEAEIPEVLVEEEDAK